MGTAITVAPQPDENSVALRNSINEWEGQAAPPPAKDVLLIKFAFQ